MARYFDRNAFLADFSRFLLQPGEEWSKAVDVSVNVVEVPNHFVIKYDYVRWGRQRLNLWQFRFEFDMEDPVARERNLIVERAFICAAKNFAEQHSKCECWPAPEQITTP